MIEIHQNESKFTKWVRKFVYRNTFGCLKQETYIRIKKPVLGMNVQ